MMVSGGNVTNIVKQLEKDGFVNRVAQEKDNRSFIVTLSEAGLEQFEKMMLAHEGWVISLMDGIKPNELQSLMENMDKLKVHIKAGVN
jgi:DNA-binding MarR family transcriptional regulator